MLHCFKNTSEDRFSCSGYWKKLLEVIVFEEKQRSRGVPAASQMSRATKAALINQPSPRLAHTKILFQDKLELQSVLVASRSCKDL